MSSPANTKKCTHCTTYKELADFPADRRSSDGKRSQCKTCINAQRNKKISCEKCYSLIASQGMAKHLKTCTGMEWDNPSDEETDSEDEFAYSPNSFKISECPCCQKELTEATIYRHLKYGTKKIPAKLLYKGLPDNFKSNSTKKMTCPCCNEFITQQLVYFHIKYGTYERNLVKPR